MNRILIAGAPRSGTTWLASALAMTPGSRLAHEPDNPAFHIDAEEAHGLYGGYAAPHVGESVPAYRRLWDAVFLEAPAAPTVIAKSVFAAFALHWLADRYSPRVVIVERHPVKVISSWMRLGFIVGDLATRERIRAEYVEPMGLPRWDPKAPRLVQVTWAVGVLMSVMRAASRARPDWTVASHEWLSAQPVMRLRSLAGGLGLAWSDAVERRIRDLGSVDEVPVALDVDGVPQAWREYPAQDRIAATRLVGGFPELAPWFYESGVGRSRRAG